MYGTAAKALGMRALPDPSVPTPLPCAATGDDSFHNEVETACAGLASAIDHALKARLTDSARLAGATIQPVVEATIAGIALEAAALRATVEHSMQRQFDGLSTRFEVSTGKDTVN